MHSHFLRKFPGSLIALSVLCIVSLGGCEAQSHADAPVAGEVSATELPEGFVQVAQESLAWLTIEPVNGQSALASGLMWSYGRVEIRQEQQIALPAPVAGRVTALHVSEGDTVEQGAALATLISPEGSSLRTAFSQAQVEHELALAEAERQQLLLDKGIGIAAEKRQADAALRQAAQELANARSSLRYLGEGKGDEVTLLAPVAGTIIERMTSLGMDVEPAQEPLFRIGNPTATWVVAELPANLLAALEVDTQVYLQLPGRAELVHGEVERLNKVLQRDTLRGKVFIRLPDTSDQLTLFTPGTLARVGIQAAEANGINIPLTALLIRDEQQPVVFVQHDNNTFEARSIIAGNPSNGRVPVLAGLQPDERIVTKGGLLLDGAASQLLY